jgi:hypothetical protein
MNEVERVARAIFYDRYSRAGATRPYKWREPGVQGGEWLWQSIVDDAKAAIAVLEQQEREP